ncbi:MAG TPA: hypothetical protein VIH35_00875 [Kiritimatiellia bacterium]|jgi:S1-C subfamily serine protease
MKFRQVAAILGFLLSCGCTTSPGPATNAGLATQDSVLKFNGKPTSATRDSEGNVVWIYQQPDGSSVIVTFNRDNTVRSQIVKPAAR